MPYPGLAQALAAAVVPQVPKDQCVIVYAWECHGCDVTGRGLKEARCWNCGRYAKVIARPWIQKDFVDEFIR